MYVLERPGCVPGLVLVGWSDFLSFRLRDTLGNPGDRLLSIEIVSVKRVWVAEIRGVTENDISISV